MKERLKIMMGKTFRVAPTAIPDAATMKDVPGWDSLTHMDLIITLEKEFNIQLSGDEIAQMQSLNAIEAVLNQRGVS